MAWFILLLVLLGLAALASLVLSENRFANIKLVAEKASNPHRLIELFRQFGGLPSFLMDPEMSETTGLAWLNNALAVAWPHVEKAASEFAFKDNFMEQQVRRLFVFALFACTKTLVCQ